MLWTNHYVNFSTASQMQNLCLVYPPHPPFLFITGDSSQASPFPGSIPGASFLQTSSHLLLSASPPVYCWWSLSMPVIALIQVPIICLLGFLFLLHSEFFDDNMCDGVCLTSETLFSCNQHLCLNHICRKLHPLANVDTSGVNTWHSQNFKDGNLDIEGWLPPEMPTEEHRKLFCKEIQK